MISEYNAKGRIIKGVGGLYSVLINESNCHSAVGRVMPCLARGKFRHDSITPLAGDIVTLSFNQRAIDALEWEEKDGKKLTTEAMITDIVERKSALIRPPLANLDYMLVAMAAAAPAPILSTVDKLLSIAEHNNIEPLIIIGKCELDTEKTEEIKTIYEKAGYRVFPLSARENKGIDSLKEFIYENFGGKIAAFAGASGVGKSSLMNRLFPTLSLSTGEISQKIGRGKNTTRHVELFPFDCKDKKGFLADTPGFSMLDFEHFDFFEKDDLPLTMREFQDYIGLCRYTKCTHTKEEGCAILEAVKKGDISKSRHDSFVMLFDTLKNKNYRKNKDKK